jgi:HEXXH motif-containing protein
LQLTLIERHVSCVGSEAGAAFSPWQRCPRPALGLLHGLYVFTAIAQWLTTLDAVRTLSSEDRVYVDRRRADIREEVTAVVSLPSSKALTPFGRMLAAWLLDATMVRRLPTA